MYFLPKMGILSKLPRCINQKHPKITFYCICINKFPENFEKRAQKFFNFKKSVQNFFAAPSALRKTPFSNFLPPLLVDGPLQKIALICSDISFSLRGMLIARFLSEGLGVELHGIRRRVVVVISALIPL